MIGARILALLALLTTPAFAQTTQTIVNPSLWHVHGPKGDAYILGAIHILPPTLKWRIPKIEAAIAKSDVFVFELSLDKTSLTQLQNLMTANGDLPNNQRLDTMIAPQYRQDFNAAVAASGLNPEVLVHKRPWLAGFLIMLAQIGKINYAANNGPDILLMAETAAAHKEQRFLETTKEQFEVLAPSDPKVDLEGFESSLKDLRNINTQVQSMVDAWSKGDQKALDSAINGGLNTFPNARASLLDNRNARWMPKIVAMLKEKHTFFITVGAGHLTGPKGLPALLRKAGYKVDGPA